MKYYYNLLQAGKLVRHSPFYLQISTLAIKSEICVLKIKTVKTLDTLIYPTSVALIIAPQQTQRISQFKCNLIYQKVTKKSYVPIRRRQSRQRASQSVTQSVLAGRGS